MRLLSFSFFDFFCSIETRRNCCRYCFTRTGGIFRFHLLPNLLIVHSPTKRSLRRRGKLPSLQGHWRRRGRRVFLSLLPYMTYFPGLGSTNFHKALSAPLKIPPYLYCSLFWERNKRKKERKLYGLSVCTPKEEEEKTG